MNDPKRWADDAGGATALERELFRSGQAAALPAEEKRRQWLAIAEQAALLPAASIPAAPHALAGKAAAKGLASGTGWLKALALLPVLAGAGAGAYALTHSAPNRAAPPAATHVATAVPGAAPNRDERGDSPAAVAPGIAAAGPDTPKAAAPSHEEPAVSASRASVAKGTATAGSTRDRVGAAAPAEAAITAGPSGLAGETVAEVATTSHLAEEARAVLEARNALRTSNPSAALRILDDARARFPNGALGQEREALTIESLARAGKREVASTRARAFLTRFPKSPLASNVRRFE